MREPNDREASDRIGIAKAIFDDNVTMAIAACDGPDPWIAKVFFVEDEPGPGLLDMCCCVVLGASRRETLERQPRVAFVVGGDEPDRWLTGLGSIELIDDEAEHASAVKRLEEKVPAAGEFLRGLGSIAVRIHVERLKVTDLGADPPVAEFTFA